MMRIVTQGEQWVVLGWWHGKERVVFGPRTLGMCLNWRKWNDPTL